MKKVPAIFRNRGFTLVEMVMVLALFSFLVVTMFGAYYQIRNVLHSQSDSALTATRAIMVLKTLSDDLNNLYTENSANLSQVFLVKKEIVAGKRMDTANFASSRYYANPGVMQASVRSVTWFGRVNDDTGEAELFRKEDIFLDPKNPRAGLPVPIFPEATKLEIRFSRDGSAWSDEWDYFLQRAFPKYIQITLGWKEGDKDREYTFEVRPPMQNF